VNLIAATSFEDLSFARNGLLLEGLSGLRYSNSSVVLGAGSSRVRINELEISLRLEVESDQRFEKSAEGIKHFACFEKTNSFCAAPNWSTVGRYYYL
jgi:hypothetical protein